MKMFLNLLSFPPILAKEEMLNLNDHVLNFRQDDKCKNP